LFVMTVASGSVRPLHVSRGNDTGPSVSPDGRFVVFSSDRDGPGDLYVLEIATNALTRLTTGMGTRGGGSWSRTGSRLLFSAPGTSELEEIYIVNRDGSGLRRLTRGQEGVR
jgi:TolB protein